ncbi:hypothetical protein OHD16_06940 [Sphingobacterium sp. ML3W]|uniref:hypothetical protein n=1 Tax=Sphingobacterium sp. ML3W TaxID=1538644 RepID=UPI002499D8B6|nr:hypothetical protein [Sphingobacterium sp. ML3W]WFA79705.1 hypothetical protein OGI71_00080 [Sphingobacterium sp. ML3W]
MSDLVSMQVSPEIIKPIVEAKIKDAIASALGGPDAIVEQVVKQVLTQKVSANGNVSSYSSDNKYTWIDAVVTSQIREAVQTQIKEQMTVVNGVIQEEVKKFLQSKKGSSHIAQLLCSSMANSIGNLYRTTVNVSFQDTSNED